MTNGLTNKKTSNQRVQLEGVPSLCSLKDLEVQIPKDIRDHLAKQYRPHTNWKQNGGASSSDGGDENPSYERINFILQAMKTPPAATVCRVNLIQGTREGIQAMLEQELSRQGLDTSFNLEPDKHLHDVLHVRSSVTEEGRIDLVRPIEDDDPEAPLVFPTWPQRQDLGWPLKHRAVVVDRLCGEAVLRGSHIFVKGIMCADKGIQQGETIAVYADVRSTIHKDRRLKRGYFLEQYRNRLCVYLGMGISMFQRSEFFRLEKGVGIQMLLTPNARVGPMLPPISSLSMDDSLIRNKLFFQNLPSLLVAHTLDPQPGDVILDMCAAPGGKTSHVASLVQNNATIIACDKSRKKMIAAQQLFLDIGATCITALALNTTNAVLQHGNNDDGKRQSVAEILQASGVARDGLLNVKGFPPESFDRIVLDPPCSALGLRPKLQIVHTTLEELQQVCLYQQKFTRQAVQLLKPGGIMTYSTCTFHADENERMVHYMLEEYPCLQLLPVLGAKETMTLAMGQPGLPGMGLSEEQRGFVRRFDPTGWRQNSSSSSDTIGFFVAKFQKQVATCM